MKKIRYCFLGKKHNYENFLIINHSKNFSYDTKFKLNYKLENNENDEKLILGISKRIEKEDKFKYLYLDYSLMDFDQNIYVKDTLKFKFLDFSDSIFSDKNTRKSYLFATNNKFVSINKIQSLSKNGFTNDQRYILNKKYEDEFIKSKLKVLGII